MQLFARVSATTAAVLVAAVTFAPAATASEATAGTEGREFSTMLTRDFSITNAQASHPVCLLAHQDGIVADAAGPAAACR